MKKRIIDGIEVQRSSGNVYADLGLPDAERLKIKTGLVVEIRKSMRRLGLTQQQAAKRVGVTQPKVSDMMRGDFSNLSERKLMDCLSRLGYDIEIKVKPASEAVGHLMLANIRVPMFVVSTERDHVSPWPSIYKINLLTATKVNFLL